MAGMGGAGPQDRGDQVASSASTHEPGVIQGWRILAMRGTAFRVTGCWIVGRIHIQEDLV
jgi:hypothetical protein